jgi:hypothetical protein
MQNRWREEDPDVEIDLRAANLKDADFTGVNPAEAKKGRDGRGQGDGYAGRGSVVVKQVWKG